MTAADKKITPNKNLLNRMIPPTKGSQKAEPLIPISSTVRGHYLEFNCFRSGNPLKLGFYRTPGGGSAKTMISLPFCRVASRGLTERKVQPE